MLDVPSQRVSPRPNPPVTQPAAYNGKPARLLDAARILLNTLQAGHRLSATVDGRPGSREQPTCC